VHLTGGSWSTRTNFDAMRRAAAAGRIALIEAGAEMLGAKREDCVARDSAIVDTAAKKSASFADIVKNGKAMKTFTPEEMKAIKLKTPDQYVLIGQSLPQLDIPAKTRGEAKYGIDTFLPGMVYGRPVSPPVRYGATVKAVDDSAAKAVPGYLQSVVLDDKTGTTTGWVVVVATNYPAAIKAANLLKVDYDKGPNANASSGSILAAAKEAQKDDSKGMLFVKAGDSGAAFESAATKFEAEYTTSINIHAPLEPMNCLASIEDGFLHLYFGNQFFTRTGPIAAAALGVDPKNVVMHQHYLGGGFGRRLEGDMAVVAALTAKAVGKPVKVIYSRETDMTMDFSRPLTFQKVRGGLDANGKLVAMEHDVVGAWPFKRWGIPEFMSPTVDKKGVLDASAVNGADHWYSTPNHTVRLFLNEAAEAATPSGEWRSVAPGWTFWAVESAVDELAHAAKQDPLQFRIGLLDGAGDNDGGAQRLRNALLAAAGLSGYGAVKLPKGEGYGIACISSQERANATWTACVAQVAVADDGSVKVKKLTIATDVGTAVNPDGIRAQVEGAALWGYSLAMLEKATMESGAIQQRNFDQYTPMRMEDRPEVAISVIANGESPTGVGEPATTVVAPAIANAIFNAVGARVRSLPITASAVKAAMKT
jgi:isoquinoline 1-oxidoreductase